VYKRRIRAAEWMLPETREKAVLKAERVRVKVGYPDKWRDYSGLTIEPGDAYGNRKRAYEFEWNRLVSRMNDPVDRDEFQYAPQAVNAYYYPAMNEICFLAAILQPPNFDPNADLAVNYGGIGAVIGHEMGHGYDDQGAKSDERGVMRDWWQPQDVERFRELGQRLVGQYSAFEPLPGLHVDGARTLGENIGDLSGVTAALDAYHDSLGGKPAPVLDGFTGDQRFFLGWAQVWRMVIRDARLRSQVATDSHSPNKFRVQGVVRNMDAWYDAFDVQPGAKLYLSPEDRVRIW